MPPGRITGQYDAVDPTIAGFGPGLGAEPEQRQAPTPWYPAPQPPPRPQLQYDDDDNPNDPVAVAAWVLGVLGGIGGIVCGVIALRRIKESGRPGRWMAVADIALGLVWVVAAVVLIRQMGPGAAGRDGSGDIDEAGELSAFSFRLGDCWNDPPLDTSVSDVIAVPCDQPHDAEVYAVFSLDEGDGGFPGDDAVADSSQAGCVERFTEFAGAEYAVSELEVVYLSPTSDSWESEGDRVVVCSVSDPAGRTTGSLRQSGAQSYP
jgi:hypothetical protein